MRFFNWLFGHKKKTPYTPWVEFGTGAKVKLPNDVNEYVKFTKYNTMIDPNHPAFPVTIPIGYCVGVGKYVPDIEHGLTIRAELAARFTAANIMANYSDVEGNVRSAIIHADELIKQLNGTT